ncbi:hypothetical protein FHX73_113362 [Kitasatospora viridis]|uniref:Uncharacterized protein n=2 Tax=Kitasatospora viridis TaxID=281105 RepID=A0A561UJK0_9ACTN|nr:hypothetical protein [Kitasatospora viridis]TWF99515.1 hypothetical protein FHX73_113362 [Kitasatospora viridis]
MWEARAVDGRGAELLGWARERLLPALAGASRLELLSAPGDRVLVIAWWPEGVQPGAPVEPPAELLARPVHRWSFRSEYVVSEQPAESDR